MYVSTFTKTVTIPFSGIVPPFRNSQNIETVCLAYYVFYIVYKRNTFQHVILLSLLPNRWYIVERWSIILVQLRTHWDACMICKVSSLCRINILLPEKQVRSGTWTSMKYINVIRFNRNTNSIKTSDPQEVVTSKGKKTSDARPIIHFAFGHFDDGVLRQSGGSGLAWSGNSHERRALSNIFT